MAMWNGESTFSYVLWNRRLIHISQETMKRLVKYGILSSLPDSSWSCIEGKLTKNKRKGSKCSSNRLEIICTDIYELFLMPF